MVDLDDNRLETAVSFGATHKVNSSDPEKAIKEIQLSIRWLDFLSKN